MIHLKLRTEYSFGQTFAPIERIIKRLKELNVTAAGIVDSSTWGHVRWFNACNAAGIQPLLGVELVVNDGIQTPKMWFLAKNKEGLKEMYRFTSDAHREKQMVSGKPRLYRAEVEQMSDNIFKFAGDITDKEWLSTLSNIYVDLSPASRVLSRIKQRMGLDCVNVCDNSYVYEEDRQIFEVASRAGLKMTPQHITEIHPIEWEPFIAKECEELELPVAPQIHVDGDLEALCRERMELSDRYEQRLQKELSVIREKNFESYFLVVADMVSYAKKHMLVGPSRGSAAGSLVCYLTGITEIDPIKNGLSFERFIDSTRKDLPDIDLDFPDEKRSIVFDHMRLKYGVRNVSNIGTISRFKSRSALVQACRALEISPKATGAVKAEMLDTLKQTFERTEAGKKFLEGYPHAKVAADLEGHASHSGVHAAGLLVTNDEIIDYCTVDGNGIAHVEKQTAEDIGLLKIDVLGLRTLSVLEEAGVNVDWYNLPLDDQKTFDLYNSGKLCGIFQFEGQALRSIARDTTLDSIADIDAVTALARPGPMLADIHEEWIKRKKEGNYTSTLPYFDDILANTYGLPIYQEQTLAIVKRAGFTDEEAALIRKSISKTGGKAIFDDLKSKFIRGAECPEKEAQKMWSMLETMGAWQMNLAHTRSYAILSYWTAYLKAHHPLEFTKATLMHSKSDENSLELLREMVGDGLIDYVPFDRQKSKVNWSIQDGKLVGGWLCLEGVGEKKAETLANAAYLNERQEEFIKNANNPFEKLSPLYDLYKHFYDDDDRKLVEKKVDYIQTFVDEPPPHKNVRTFICEIVKIEIRDINDEINLKKRGGVRKEAENTRYIALKIKDDSGSMYARISHYDYKRIGIEFLEKMRPGDHMLCKGKFFNNIAFAFIFKWQPLKYSGGE